MYRHAIPQTLGGCVSLPAKHYRLLLEIVSAGTWMICSGDACPDPSFRNSVKDLYQQFLKLGEEQGLAQDVWCSPEDGLMHHESFEEQQGAAWKALEAYEQESFVLNFGRRLGREMAIHEIGAEAWAAIGQSERLERVAAYEERIQGMLARHGWFGLLLGSAESGG